MEEEMEYIRQQQGGRMERRERGVFPSLSSSLTPFNY
jgi:hypothetical protein